MLIAVKILLVVASFCLGGASGYVAGKDEDKDGMYFFAWLSLSFGLAAAFT